MSKKNKNFSNKFVWTNPPFSRQIKLLDLNINKKNIFKINLVKKEINSLEKFLGVQSINTFDCNIYIIFLRNKWEISGNISISLTMRCVISLEDLEFNLQIPVKRYLTSDFQLNKDIDTKTDPIAKIVDLGDIISEELYLEIPEYPKKKGAKLNNYVVFEDENIPNPFKKLENLKI